MLAILRIKEWEKVTEISTFNIKAGYVDESFYSPTNLLVGENEPMSEIAQEAIVARFWHMGRTKKNMPIFEYRS